eukprot:9490132-Pyramimonas_sp.AAC.1
MVRLQLEASVNVLHQWHVGSRESAQELYELPAVVSDLLDLSLLPSECCASPVEPLASVS